MAQKSQVVEYEGQQHEFPADFTDADIAKALKSYKAPSSGKFPDLKAPQDDPFNSMIQSEFIKSRPPEEARRLLTARSKYFAGLKPDAQDKILAGLPGPKEAKSDALSKVVTGAEQGGKEVFVDFPKSIYHAATDKPTEQEIGRARRHPKLFADPQRGVGLALDRLILDPQLEEYKKAQKTSGVEKAGHLGAAALPGIGPMAAHFGEKIGRGEIYESLGEGGVLWLTGKAFGKLTEKVEPFKRMAKAAGDNAKDFEVVASDLSRSASRYGRPRTVGELEQLVKNTGRDMETEFNVQLQPIASQQRMPTEVAQALLDRANSSHLLKTPEGRAIRQYLRQKATDYQRPWTLGELNKQRMDMFNARLESKTQVGQMAAVKSNAEVMADKIIEDKLRDIVYGDMEAHYGSSTNFRLLKQKQSRILNIMDNLEKQTETLAQAQAEIEAAGPVEKLGLSLSAHGGGVTPRIHGLLKTLQGGPEIVANKQVRKAFPAGLKDIGTKTGAKDMTSQAMHTALRQAVRNLPLAALFEESKKPPEKDKKKSLPALK